MEPRCRGARALRVLEDIERVISDLLDQSQGGAEYTIAARLHGQMNPFAEVFVLVDGRHYVRVKVARKRGRELNSFHSPSGHCPQEAAEGGSTFVLFKAGQGFRPIAI